MDSENIITCLSSEFKKGQKVTGIISFFRQQLIASLYSDILFSTKYSTGDYVSEQFSVFSQYV